MHTDKQNLQIDSENLKFYKEALDAHNELRALHNAKKLYLNLKLCEIAQSCANKYARVSCIRNDENTFYSELLGENIVFQFSHSKNQINGTIVSKIWYKEVKNFDFSDPKFEPITGHFTQLIWKNTTDVGFARAIAENGSCYVVAKYYPAGNIPGEFSVNVERSIK